MPSHVCISIFTEAECTVPALTMPNYPPQIFDSGTEIFAGDTVAFGTSLTFTCSQHQPTPLEFIRDCVYDPVNNQYVVQYDFSVDCPSKLYV